MKFRTFLVFLATVTILFDVIQAYDNYDYEEDYQGQDNNNNNDDDKKDNSSNGNNGNDYNENKNDNQGDKGQNQDNDQKKDNGGNNYNDNMPDPKENTGPIQFPAAPENLITSGVVIGASGYGFKAPEHFIGGHTYQWSDYK